MTVIVAMRRYIYTLPVFYNIQPRIFLSPDYYEISKSGDRISVRGESAAHKYVYSGCGVEPSGAQCSHSLSFFRSLAIPFPSRPSRALSFFIPTSPFSFADIALSDRAARIIAPRRVARYQRGVRAITVFARRSPHTLNYCDQNKRYVVWSFCVRRAVFVTRE